MGRGFFAEIAHQQRLHEQHQRRQTAAAVQAHNKAVREAERAQREYVRAVAAYERAAELEQAYARAAAREAHVTVQKAEAESRTTHALNAFEQIDSILGATLDVDDFVDLDLLMVTVEHPPFPRDDLRTPLPKPPRVVPRPEPEFVAPPPPTGASKLFGKKKHAEATAEAHALWEEKHKKWAHRAHTVLPAMNAEALENWTSAERQREKDLAEAEDQYQRECTERERDAVDTNQRLLEFKDALAAGDPCAINEYVGVVLGNSAYPESFDVAHEYQFDADLGELTVAAVVPPPTSVLSVKAYKYVAASDEIRETACTQKEQRDRYNGAIAAVAIRTFHEVFESDREERIKTISLRVQTETINPATGLVEKFPFVAAAADRDDFVQYDLRHVDPAETLALMRAQVSKNAFGLKPISMARGIR
jgi:restriction system protein